MASKSPWSVKGVSQEDRDQAKSAARRAGVPVGVWLSQQIRAAESRNSAHDGDGSKPTEEEVRFPHPLRGQPFRGRHEGRFSFVPGQWSTATDAVEGGKLPKLAPGLGPPPLEPVTSSSNPAAQHAGQHVPPVATHWGMPPLAHPMYLPPARTPPEPNTAEIHPDALKELEKQLESVETKMARDFRDVCGRLEQIGGLEKRIDSLRAAMESKAENVYSTAPMERAIVRLSERLEGVEELVLPSKPTRGLFSRLFRRD